MKKKNKKWRRTCSNFLISAFFLAQCRLHFVPISHSAFSSHVSVRVDQTSSFDPSRAIYPSNA